MLDFTLTEQQRNIRELAHDFAQKEIRPVAWEYDRDATWPEQIIRKAWDVGLMNSQLPEKYGGAGASYVDGVLIGEELAWGCAAIGTTLGTNELAAAPVLLGGSEKIKAEYLEAARLLAWQSAVLLDQGKRNTLQSSHAKRFAADTAMKVATDAVQTYGG
jgi:alkylation response protein AidB-like acyl-CoA dehydrogenase